MFYYVNESLDFAHKLDGHTLPSNDFEKHMHSFCELLFFIRGTIDYTIESKVKRLDPGDLLIIQPGDLHFGTVDPKKHYERYVLKFPESLLPKFLNAKIRGHSPFFSNCMYLLSEFEELDEIYDKYDEDEKGVLMPAQLLRILIHLRCDDVQQSNENVIKKPFISEIIDYINAHICSSFDLNDICSALHYSKSYLCNEFAKEMKTSLMTYVKHKKIIAAHKEICGGNVKLTEIAERYGYSDYSTFYRNYTKIMGHPPKDSIQ